MKHLLLFGMMLLLAACAPSPPGEYPPDRAIEHWVGRPVDDVIAAWGEPTARVVDGEKQLFIWEASHYDRRYYPANLNNEPRFPFLGGRDEIACKGVFEVGPQGRVEKAEWQGYECHNMP